MPAQSVAVNSIGSPNARCDTTFEAAPTCKDKSKSADSSSDSAQQRIKILKMMIKQMMALIARMEGDPTTPPAEIKAARNRLAGLLEALAKEEGSQKDASSGSLLSGMDEMQSI